MCHQTRPTAKRWTQIPYRLPWSDTEYQSVSFRSPDTQSHLSKPMHDFMLKVFEAVNESGIGVALKIEGTSWLYERPPEHGEDLNMGMPFHYDSRAIWSVPLEGRWGYRSFERKCHDEDQPGDPLLSISFSTVDLEFILDTEHDGGGRWDLDIDTFGVTPIQKDVPFSIGHCDLPLLGKPGMFSFCFLQNQIKINLALVLPGNVLTFPWHHFSC